MCLLPISLLLLSALINFNVVQCNSCTSNCLSPVPCAECTSPIQGACPQVYVPFKANGDVDFEKIPVYMEKLHSLGIACVFLNMESSGGQDLQTNIKIQTTVEFIKAGKKRGMASVARVGGQSKRNSMNMAKAVAEAGASAILVEPPTLYVINNTADMIYYICLFGKYGVPVMYYDNPDTTESYLNVGKIWRGAMSACPKSFGGVVTDLLNFLLIKGNNKILAEQSIVVYNFVEIASATAYCAKAVTSVAINAFAKETLRIIQYIRSGEFSKGIYLQECVNSVVSKTLSELEIEVLGITAELYQFSKLRNMTEASLEMDLGSLEFPEYKLPNDYTYFTSSNFAQANAKCQKL